MPALRTARTVQTCHLLPQQRGRTVHFLAHDVAGCGSQHFRLEAEDRPEPSDAAESASAHDGDSEDPISPLSVATDYTLTNKSTR